MNEKKTNIAALILSVVVVFVAVFGVKFAGGSVVEKEAVNTPGTSAGEENAETAGKYAPGTYTATAKGMGDVTVTITVGEDGNIAEVAIDGPTETAGIGTNAIEQLPDVIKTAQSAEVDVIGGASITSNAIIEAATSCLEQASAN